MKIGIVCQSAGDRATYFSHATGLQDGVYARNYGASEIGQPNASAIYFAVDFDANVAETNERIIPYFEAIAETFLPSPNLPEYQVGVYGNGVVCETLVKRGLVQFTWLSQSTGHHGHKRFKASNQWTLFQHLSSELCDISVDTNDLNPAMACFGEFSELLDPSDFITDEIAAPAHTPFASHDMLGASNQDFVSWFNAKGFKHFKPYELLVMGGKNSNPQSPCFRKNTLPPQKLWINIVPTIEVLDILLARLNAPIRITSAYRSPAYNKCIGGATESAHMQFQALDFIVEGNSRPSDWARTLRSMRDDEGLFQGGVGLYTGFVHVDTNGKTRDW